MMPASPDVVDQALAQVELGFAAFALQRNGKKPITEHGFKNASTNPEWVRTQLEAPDAGNYGITWPEDRPDRVLAIDLDNGQDGRARPWQDRLLEQIERIAPLPPTKATTTPSGGRHAFYRWPAGMPVPSGDELFGFTVRWPGKGYLVGPGSSIDGILYQAGPVDVIADLPPEWVSAAVEERRGTRNRSDFVTITGGRYEIPERIASGRRYGAVRDFVASRYNDDLPLEDLWELVKSRVAPHFEVPKDETALRSDFERVVAKIHERLGPPRHRAGAPAAIPIGPLEDAPLTDFISTPVEWLWPSWLPRGVVTLMDGNPGVSKSTIVADLVARITTGREWPDGQPNGGGPRRVMWITTEDDPGRVLRPRIEAAGGIASLVRFAISEVVFPSGAGAFRELVVQRAAEEQGLALVVLDPLFSHIEASVRTIADAEMRKGVMNPLGETAEKANVAMLVVRHFNKDSQASALNRGAGSLGGIVGAARALWSVAHDPEDETKDTKVIGVAKLNYARAKPPLRYRVIDLIPPGWVAGTVSGIEWLGEAAVSIDAMMAEGEGIADAVATLEQLLGRGPLAANQAQSLMKARGFGRTAIRGAAARLRLVRTKSGFTGGWSWSLPEESQPVEDAAPEGSEAASSASSVLAGAHARGVPAPSDSSTSWEDGAGLRVLAAEESQPVEDAAASRGRVPGRAHAHEGPTVVCHYPHDHGTSWRQTTPGVWVCPICDPEGPAA